MKKSLLIIIAILVVLPLAHASHVVGGDIFIQWKSANNYHIKLRAYRDDVNGIAMPASITIGVYDAVTHAQVTTQTLTQTSLGIVPLGDPCYTPDPNVVRIEEGIFESPVDIFLADNPNGYYLQAQINARNSLAINVIPNGTMSWFAMMPDPALGQNSSPDFGNYPNDAYFCINSPKFIQYPIIDPDGDSLAYSLVQPLDAWTPSNGTFAGSGAYPFYPGLAWAGTYNIADIIGGATPMSINPNTGLITAAPSALGFFTFAIRVEEFRNGVKIGETRRDVQYISLNCTSDAPPFELSGLDDSLITIPFAEEFCQDIIFRDVNTTDTLFIEIASNIFQLGAAPATLTPYQTNPNMYLYTYNNFNDSVLTPQNTWVDSLNSLMNIGTIGYRFCWTPSCEHLSQIPYDFQVKAFSLGCSGRIEDTINFQLQVARPEGLLSVIPNVFTPNDDGMNDTYQIGGYSNPCTDKVHTEVFNRWGLKVYESDEIDFEWDGKNKSGNDVPPGTYFVLIKGIYGEVEIEQEKRTVTLLR